MKLGVVGTISGPLASSLLAHLQGIQVWSKWVNSRGGVNGHEVQLIVADDGGDPARYRAALQELVETRHVIAFLHNPAPLTSESGVEYLEAKRIPSIGMTGAEIWAHGSPMAFPAASTGDDQTALLFSSMAQQAIAQGKKKFGMMVCTEAQICRDWFDNVEKYAGSRGLEVVYKARISIAQPDFTAECLSARNAGADIFFIGATADTVRRGAASCARQGYRPVIGNGGTALVDNMKNDPNLDGLVAGFGTFPYFQPPRDAATAEFHEAMSKFGSNLDPAGGLALSWVSGKLFEKAAANLDEPPSAESLLAGLWAIKNDDLGGLTMPLTFQTDQPPPHQVCWWNVTIVDGKWASPDNFRRSCER